MLTVVRFALRSTVIVTLAVPGLFGGCTATTFNGVRVNGVLSFGAPMVLGAILFGWGACCWICCPGVIRGLRMKAGLGNCAPPTVVVGVTLVGTTVAEEETGGAANRS